MKVSKTPYTLERALMEKRGLGGSRNDALSVPDAEKILLAIKELRMELLGETGGDSGDGAGGGPGEEVSNTQIYLLRGQLHELKECIDKTKREIVAVRRPGEGGEGDRLITAAMELDAIVKATEEATHSILNATEDIDERVQIVKERVGDHKSHELLDEISNLTISIFEACNFQDISGQRTTKVVKTLNFLEDRIHAMIDIWGDDDFAHITAVEEELGGDAALLQGPQLEDQGVSQDDIDKLFD